MVAEFNQIGREDEKRGRSALKWRSELDLKPSRKRDIQEWVLPGSRREEMGEELPRGPCASLDVGHLSVLVNSRDFSELDQAQFVAQWAKLNTLGMKEAMRCNRVGWLKRKI
jgi:hypothetical protein